VRRKIDGEVPTKRGYGCIVQRPSLRELVQADVDAAGPTMELEDSLEQAAAILAAERSTTGRVMRGDRCIGTVSIFDLVSALLPSESGNLREGSAEPSAVVLRFRKIGDNQDMLAQFESLADAKTWLAERPKLVRVLRVEEPELPPRVEADLHDAMRPFDDEELEAIADVQRKLQQLHSVELRDLQTRAEREAAHVASTSSDPPFVLRYEKDRELVHARSGDDRPIPDAVRSAVLAWVKRRNEWVHARRQHVGAAVLTIPATIDTSIDAADAVEVEGEVELLSGFADA
jgi:hypothetical protein